MSEQTSSMRRAVRWLAESHAAAAAIGEVVDATTVALFEHIGACHDCILREHNDPELCEIADEILDGPDEDATP